MTGTLNLEILQQTDFNTVENNESFYVDLDDLMHVCYICTIICVVYIMYT